MRCAPRGGHHDLFLLRTPDAKRGLNHVAFTVRDIHEVFGGGLFVSGRGWETQLGPGRHPISSAYFWYFRNPAGGLIEYYADEQLTGGPATSSLSTVFAEWAIRRHRRQPVGRRARPMANSDRQARLRSKNMPTSYCSDRGRRPAAGW
jgi:hypothetical protein